jgi:hypothetical protein
VEISGSHCDQYKITVFFNGREVSKEEAVLLMAVVGGHPL